MALNKTGGFSEAAIHYTEQQNGEPPVLRQIREATMASGHPKAEIWPIPVSQGKLLKWLLRDRGAYDVAEIGTFTGYSTAALALGLPDGGRVITCDIAAEPFESIGKPIMQQEGLGDKVTFMHGKALVSLGELATSGQLFDAVFIDGDKTEYPQYYEAAKELTRGLIIVDNTLWHGGRVADPEDTDKTTLAIRTVNKQIQQDEENGLVDQVMLPFADGLTFVSIR